MIKGKIEGVEKLEGAIQKVSKRILSETKRILRTEAVLMAAHIKKDLMSGPRPEKLGVRTGALRSSVKSMAVTESPGLIESGVGFGTIYARTHVGPVGQVTTISAKTGKYLTVPLPDAMTPSGVLRGSARSGIWGKTFFARSKKGNLILFGQKAVQSRANRSKTASGGTTWSQFTSERMSSYMSKYGGHGPAIQKIAEEWKTYKKGLMSSTGTASKSLGPKQARGQAVPLFLLVKQVKIKARIHPEEILAWEKPKMIAAFRNIGVNLKGA